MREKQNVKSLENQKDELKYDVKVRYCASNCREIVPESEKHDFVQLSIYVIHLKGSI